MSRTLDDAPVSSGGFYHEGVYSLKILEITGLTPADTPNINISNDRLQFKAEFVGAPYAGKKLVFWRSLTTAGERLTADIMRTADLGPTFYPDAGDYSIQSWLKATAPLIGKVLPGRVKVRDGVNGNGKSNEVYFNPPAQAQKPNPVDTELAHATE